MKFHKTYIPSAPVLNFFALVRSRSYISQNDLDFAMEGVVTIVLFYLRGVFI